MNTLNNTITIEEFFKYVEFLLGEVERHLSGEGDAHKRQLLLRLKSLLVANHLKDVVEGLKMHQVNIPAIHKIEEIDDTLDELHMAELDLPYPEKYFVKEARKRMRSGQISIMILLFGLMGFELVVK